MENKINGLRFIVGSGCNYDCFYCHHEGLRQNERIDIDDRKLDILYNYAKQKEIKELSITGGEPFLYWQNVKKILEKFDNDKYRITLNSNFSLADKYYEPLERIKNTVEFHVNLSAVNKQTHESIINCTYLDRVLKNLEMYKDSHHKICLNILAIKGVNDHELLDIYNYAVSNGFYPRILTMMVVNEEDKDKVMTIDEILSLFTNPKIGQKYAHGLYKVESNEGNFEILKTICADLECDICAKNTFIHMTPNLDIKYCLREEEIIPCDYTSVETLDKSFKLAQKKLVLRGQKNESSIRGN